MTEETAKEKYPKELTTLRNAYGKLDEEIHKGLNIINGALWKSMNIAYKIGFQEANWKKAEQQKQHEEAVKRIVKRWQNTADNKNKEIEQLKDKIKELDK